MNAISEAWDAGLHIFDTLPPSIGAFIIGWMFSVAITMTVKKTMIPRWWHEYDRDLTVRLVAFFSAATSAGYAYVGLKGASEFVFIVMALTGLWAPIAYVLLILYLRSRKNPFWSRVADALSGDPK